MTRVVVHYDDKKLPRLNKNVVPVQIYGLDGWKKGNVATIGNAVIDTIRRLGARLTPAVFDYLTLALAVTSADTFVQRKESADGCLGKLN